MDWLKRLLARLRRRPAEESPFVPISIPGGPPTLADRETLAFLQSTAPAPSQASLDALLGRAHRVRVIAGGCARGKPIGHEVLLETADPEALSGLRAALRIVEAAPDNVSHCMCFGDPTIELLDSEGARLAAISSHHGEAIRWDDWTGDGELVDGLALLRWFANHGVTYPMEDYSEAR